jgi:hypothetical protein
MTAILVHTDRPAATVQARWFRVVLGGYEPIAHDDGTTTQEFVIDGVNIEVAAGGCFGWGEQAAIAAHVAQHRPGREVIDTWPIARPIVA